MTTPHETEHARTATDRGSTGAGPPPIRIPTRPIGWFLAVMVVVLALGHLVSSLLHHGWLNDVIVGEGPLSRLLDMDEEGNLPSWYSASGLLVAGALAAVVWQRSPRGNGGFRLHWLILAIVMVYFSLDEAASLHEELSRPLSERTDLGAEDWVYYAWILPYGALLVAFVIFFIPFLRGVPRRTRNLTVLAGALFVSGALGMELVGRAVVDDDRKEPLYQLTIGIEESLEIAGVAVLIMALLLHIRDHVGPVALAVDGPTADPDDTSNGVDGRTSRTGDLDR